LGITILSSTKNRSWVDWTKPQHRCFSLSSPRADSNLRPFAAMDASHSSSYEMKLLKPDLAAFEYVAEAWEILASIGL